MTIAMRLDGEQGGSRHSGDREQQLALLIRGSRDGELERKVEPEALCRSCFTYREVLHKVGLRPTRQRMMLGWILFSRGNRHVTAEMLYDEVLAAKMTMSLATVYNTLHQFTEAGLLRQIAVEGAKTFFDTNPSEHHHFFVEGDHEMIDIPGANVPIERLPEPPAGYEIARIDVTVRLRRKPV